MEENKNGIQPGKKHIKSFEESLKQQKNNAAINQGIVDSITNVFKVLSATGKQFEEDEETHQVDYLNQLLEYINSLDAKSGLLHLQNEKIKYERKIITANIKRDRSTRKIYENIVNIIIKPLIISWEEKNKLPEKNISVISVEPIEIEPFLSKDNHLNKDDCSITPVAAPGGYINCNASKQQIRDYFYTLITAINPDNKKPYMLEKDVELLIRTNFRVFGEASTGSYFDINLTSRTKGRLQYFIYEFYLKFELDQIGTKPQYVNFLIRNFALFKDAKPASLNSNMNNSKRPSARNIISKK